MPGGMPTAFWCTSPGSGGRGPYSLCDVSSGRTLPCRPLPVRQWAPLPPDLQVAGPTTPSAIAIDPAQPGLTTSAGSADAHRLP